MGSITEERVVLKLDEKLKAIYEQIGKKFYMEANEKEITDAVYCEYFSEIKKILNEKNILEEKKLAQQGKKRCMGCQNIVPIESKFCNMCGVKLPEVEFVEAESVSSIRKCSECGNILEEDALFCTNCGKKIF